MPLGINIACPSLLGAEAHLETSCPVSLSPFLLGAEANLEISCLVLCCRCFGQAFLQPTFGLAVLLLLLRSLQRGFSLELRHLKYVQAGENE